MRKGDLWASCGEARLKIEVKHHKREPRALQAMRNGCELLAYLCSDTGRLAVFIDEPLLVDLLAWSAEALTSEGAPSSPTPVRPRWTITSDKMVVDGEIARARLEAFIAEAGYPLLIQLEKLSRALQGRVDRSALSRVSRPSSNQRGSLR